MKKGTAFEDITLSGISAWLKSDEHQQVIVNEHFGMVLHSRLLKQEDTLSVGQVYLMAEGRIIMILEGSLDATLDLEGQTWQKGDIILLAPDTILEIKQQSDDFDMIIISFKVDVQITENMLFHPNASEWRELLQMAYLLWSLAQHQPFRRQTVFSQVATIVSNIQDIVHTEEQRHPAAKPSSGKLLFRRFKKLVSEYCDSQRNVPFYAEQLFITPHHLSAVINKQSGRSVMYWINRAVVLKAKVLLQSGDMKTNEIADRLNFPYHSTFTKFFKRETGMSPQQYRNE